jgi:hypothetical protein
MVKVCSYLLDICYNLLGYSLNWVGYTISTLYLKTSQFFQLKPIGC